MQPLPLPVDRHLKVIEKMKNCTGCSLHQNRTQVVVGDYGPKGAVCFIGEAPGYHEDQQGRPFVGKSGQLLDSMLETIGLIREQVSVLNINKCRPPENRKPTSQEMETCGNLWLGTQLNYLEPSLLVTLGSTALEYFLPGLRITKVRAVVQKTTKARAIFPLFHPAYVLRGGQTREAYQQDFALLKSILDDTSSITATEQQSTLDDYF